MFQISAPLFIFTYRVSVRFPELSEEGELMRQKQFLKEAVDRSSPSSNQNALKTTAINTRFERMQRSIKDNQE